MAPTIVIVGRPNVGKSTLFNRLSKSRDALVDNQPGVTRDRLYAQIYYEGFPLILVDTGGFDDLRQDPLLGKVRVQVERAIMDADRVIFMVDGRQGVMPADQEIADIVRRSQKEAFLAVNKTDGPEHDHLTHDFYSLGFKSVHAISAGHGYGIRSFMDDVIRDLPKSEIRKGDDNQIRVAILGRPNVGKSSLVNRILGLDRMVVSELPGTTRDTVDTLFHYHGNEYMLIDTAGIRRKAKVRERIDKFSMIKAIRSLKRCHVATILLDAEQGISEQDARICGYAFEQGKGLILAVNKWDLIKGNAREKKSLNDAIERQLRFVSFAPRINLSALTGERVMKLFRKIDLLYEQFSRRISTPNVNSAVQQMIEKHPPPRIGRGRLKFFYATQTGTKPPTFVVFVNRPDMIHFSYERFLINQLRERFRLELTPIKLRFQQR
ncbi:MAG: ribosome biogenesis GTPase Der [Thermodesulfobacteriota bacterium]|nr:ribosome biogenesis GTPase Der [Thermodesulfobacteriota bacterium]